MDYLVCHKRNYGNFPETEETISETTIDLAGLEQAVLHFYNHDSYLAAHDWIEIHPLLHGRPHQAVPIPPARYRSQVASSAEMQKGQNVINRLTNQLDMLKTEQAFLAIARRDLWALQRALSASQHHEAPAKGDKINGVPVSELKELDQEIAARSGGAPMRQSQPDLWEAWKKQVQISRVATRTFDEKWEEWKPGDKIVWDEGKFGTIFTITKINHDTGYVWWDDPAGGPEQMTRATNLYRVTLHDADASETLGVTPVPAHFADRAATLLAKLDEQAEAYGELRMVQLSDEDVRTLRAGIPFTYQKKKAAPDTPIASRAFDTWSDFLEYLPYLKKYEIGRIDIEDGPGSMISVTIYKRKKEAPRE